MQAIVQDRYGSPEVLRLAGVDRPVVAGDRVLVRVRAASVNALDWRRVRGAPFVLRFGEGLRRPAWPLLGIDTAGTVEEVGTAVRDVQPGDEVFGFGKGSLAEYVTGRCFVPKPANLTFEQAAALPVAGLTALQAVRHMARVQPGQRALVYGAGGGVGTFLVQIARASGAEVTAVSSAANLEALRSLGAEHAIDYDREDFTRSGRRYDLVFDVGGHRSLSACRRALVPGGTLVVVGAGKGIGGPAGRFLSASVRSRVLRQRVVSFVSSESRDDLLALKDLVEAGQVIPVVDRTYPLGAAADAIRYLESERARGKVVVTVGEG